VGDLYGVLKYKNEGNKTKRKMPFKPHNEPKEKGNKTE